MINIDKQLLNIKYRNNFEFRKNLLEYATQVSLAKPMSKFMLDDECVNKYRPSSVAETDPYQVNKIKVIENGEVLGYLFTEESGYGSNRREVYGVNSFRISKQRGDRNKTVTKDLKIAVRNAKQFFVSRADDELKQLISNRVKEGINGLVSQQGHHLRWIIDANIEIDNYITLAYIARLKGEPTVTLPSKLVTIKDLGEYDRKCERYYVTKQFKEMIANKKGYGILVNDAGNVIVYSYIDESIVKYDTFSDLPENIQGKFAIFKLLKELEPQANIGVNLGESFFFVES
jgi:hypothetical protein